MVLKSRDFMFKMYILQKLFIVLYSVHWYMYMFILKRIGVAGQPLDTPLEHNVTFSTFK